MKRFMLLHVGFEPPTPGMMAKWKAWFAATAPHTVENVGLRAAREISHAGVKDLGWGADSLTGFTIIHAESLDAAEAIAQTNPFVHSSRVYDLADH